MKNLVGAALLGQSGGPTSVINSSAAGVFIEALKQENITAVYGAVHGIKGVLNEDFYDIGQEDLEELMRLKHTPSSAIGSVRFKLKDPKKDPSEYERLLEVFKKYNIRYFFYNGGNDSMDTCNKISKFFKKSGYDCNVMGVPKTIDNDLNATDHSPGYASAAKYVATTFMELYHDATVYDTKQVTIVEVMGRNAQVLAEQIANRIDVKVRAIEFSLIQRSAAHLASKVDVEEAFNAGKKAVQAAVRGTTDKMVGFKRVSSNPYKMKYVLLPLKLAANTEQKVPLEWILPEGKGLTQDYVDYALPLIQGDAKAKLVDGLPQFAKLKKIRVAKK